MNIFQLIKHNKPVNKKELTKFIKGLKNIH